MTLFLQIALLESALMQQYRTIFISYYFYMSSKLHYDIDSAIGFASVIAERDLYSAVATKRYLKREIKERII